MSFCHSDPMAIVGLDHLQISMPLGGEDQAVAFYAGVLGLTQVPKPAPLNERGGCWFEEGSVHIHLGGEENFRPARKAHPALLVSDLDELKAKLATAGYEVRPGAIVKGISQWFTNDPFGNRIELIAAT